MWPILIAMYLMSVCHGLTAVTSICVGIASSLNADVWMAHLVSPIWSGGFFLMTGIVGVIAANRKTLYMVMCFGAFSAVSMVVAVVSIQLLKVGLVNHYSDGETLKKEATDPIVIIALAAAGSEILICLISGLVSVRATYKTKKELKKKNEGTFSITVLGEKDIIINTSKSASYERLHDARHTNSSGNTCKKKQQFNQSDIDSLIEAVDV